MRIWDISPGYLNRQSLLGEHRELHGIAVILAEGKKGYSRHPETLRWAGHGQALAVRHRQLACEMRLRGYREQSPLPALAGADSWPRSYLDEPAAQFALLRSKYADREPGRIPLPRTAQQLWSQHKYSVLARDVLLYKEIGQSTASGRADFAQLAKLLAELLRQPPSAGGLRNAAQHIWGHVAGLAPAPTDNPSDWPCLRLLEETQRRAMLHKEPYLLASTALAELAVWLDAP
ncbi:DUF1722 domain-containing protein [Candidatus Electronema sp. JM]|uniref:DUF1722 domain-containing protein n=1 Tax=Candidatus Electronema sp. JM TaxID=3401571 RepID=UPI003AA8ECC7